KIKKEIYIIILGCRTDIECPVQSDFACECLASQPYYNRLLTI
ncbi:MAG: hypothetical protein ACJATF_004453, partial [Flavobacteriales bacterium]